MRPTFHRRAAVFWAAQLAVIAAVMPAITAAAPGPASHRGSSTVQALADWIVAAGGQVNVAVDTINGVRGAFAAKDVQEGDLLLVVPENLTWTLKQHESPAVPALQLLRDIRIPSSARAVWWATLPRPGEVLSHYTWPQSYLDPLQASGWDDWIRLLADGVTSFYEEHPELAHEGITLKDLQWAADIMSTRSFHDDSGAAMVPLMDMANHVDLCPNGHHTKPCDFDPKRPCMYWVAGKNYSAGDELCLTYGGMYADRAFLQYGWLKEDAQPPHLFGVDRHDFEYDAPFSNNVFTGSYPEPFTADSADGYQQEASRLRTVLYFLTIADQEAAELEPAPEDSSGALLKQLLQWRALRKEALAAEIERLKEAAAALGSTVKSEEDYAGDMEAVLQDSEDQEEDPYLDEDEEDQVGEPDEQDQVGERDEL